MANAYLDASFAHSCLYRDGLGRAVLDAKCLSKLGFKLGGSLGGASEGAWAATAKDGTKLVLKLSTGREMPAIYAALLPALDALRAKGVPVPKVVHLSTHDGGTLTAQAFLPGRAEENPTPEIIAEMVRHIAAKKGLSGPLPAAPSWGQYVKDTLTIGQSKWCAHQPLRAAGGDAEQLLQRIIARGAMANPMEFPQDGLTHLDLHTDNVLIHEGRVSGLIDWESAVFGDHQYDLVQYIFDLEGHGYPAWHVVDAAGFAPNTLRAYLALLVLKTLSSAIRNCPDDVPRQLARAKRVFEHFEV